MIQTDSFTEIVEALDFVPEIPCESRRCANKGIGDHPADVYSIWSCGCVMAVCEARLVGYRVALFPHCCSLCYADPVSLVRTIPIGGSK